MKILIGLGVIIAIIGILYIADTVSTYVESKKVGSKVMGAFILLGGVLAVSHMIGELFID